MKEYKIIFKFLACVTFILNFCILNAFSETLLSDSEIKELGHKLRIEDKSNHKEILDMLMKLKGEASPATSEILASIHEGKTGKEAVDVLISIGTDPAIAGLAKLVSNSNTDLSNYIFDKIIPLKSRAEFVVEEIFSNYQNPKLKEKIIVALGEIQGDRAFYELKELLKSNEPENIRILVLKSFVKFKNAKTELPLLKKLYRNNLPSDYADALGEEIRKLSSPEK